MDLPGSRNRQIPPEVPQNHESAGAGAARDDVLGRGRRRRFGGSRNDRDERRRPPSTQARTVRARAGRGHREGGHLGGRRGERERRRLDPRGVAGAVTRRRRRKATPTGRRGTERLETGGLGFARRRWTGGRGRTRVRRPGRGFTTGERIRDSGGEARSVERATKTPVGDVVEDALDETKRRKKICATRKTALRRPGRGVAARRRG